VGLTYIALSARDHEECRRFVWDSDRQANKNLSVEAALEMLAEYLRGRAVHE
jgi:nicotinamide mononucleotide (NMN) deamidase PncC